MQQNPRHHARAIAIAKAETASTKKAGLFALAVTMTAACLYAAALYLGA